ncbi:hypothetical protein K5D34_04590 [Pseudomonas cichorii]|nr:hypothetical protein [Pseudomonas cichorii]MBX8508971.1 hypothetical protein [Pseudomonas cichorii]MBX8524534.1 hypothetical protein [Pseudomonas cichorii]
MSVLFFLPWVTTLEEQRIGTMRLIPYVRGSAPGELYGVTQETLDCILGNYGDQAFFPEACTSSHLSHSTILIWDDDEMGLEVSEEEVYRRLQNANYLVFAALSERHLCNHSGYCNSDGYKVIAQRFDVTRPGDTAYATRRRDGHGTHLVMAAGSPRFVRPQHVDDHIPLIFSPGVVAALTAMPAGELKQRIDLTIESFLRANTDSPSMTAQSEMVLMRVAFETVLDSTHNVGDLRQKLHEHFIPDLPTDVQWGPGSNSEAIWRRRWPSHVARPLDAWVQDFCAARNEVAHGPRAAGAPTIWHRHNHLLFSSWLLPLIVKKLLSTEGLYDLTEEDLICRRQFEAFFGHDLLAPSDKHESKLWWNEVESGILMAVHARRIFENLD